MRSSLFVKIYLTVLASLAVVAIASGIFVRMGMEREHAGWSGRRDAFIHETPRARARARAAPFPPTSRVDAGRAPAR